MRAQVATEYIILIGAILIILIPILYYSSYQSTAVLTLNDAEDAVNTLAKTANYVYSLGPGTRSIALITIPGGVSNSLVSEREIVLNMSRYGEVVAISKANLTGSFPYAKGIYEVAVTSLDNGVVLIGDFCNNNGVCEYAEDCSNCQLDCSCLGNENCCSGVCSVPLCNLDSECDDNDACTIDTCKNSGSCIASCTSTTVTACINDDNCCPSGCTISNDNDCIDDEDNETEEIVCGDNICSPGEDCFSCAFDCVCGEEPPPPEGGTSLKDVGIDSGIYSKTNGNGLNTLDSEMVATDNITLELLDDTLTTPPTTAVIRTRGGNKYESFNVEINQDSNQYSRIVLYGRVRIVDFSPFQLRVYPYLQDKDGIDTTKYKDFAINDEILNQKVKWVELDITDIVKTQDNFGFIKTRVTALNDSSQDNKRFQFSELHYKVG